MAVSVAAQATISVAVQTQAVAASGTIRGWLEDPAKRPSATGRVEVHLRVVPAPVPPPGGTVDPTTGVTTPPVVDDPANPAPFASPQVVLIPRVSPWLPDPRGLTNPNGRMATDAFQPTYNSVTKAFGRLRVVVNGKDVTHFRGGHAQVKSYRVDEPLGPDVAQVHFDVIQPWEVDRFGHGDLAWLIEGANVEIDVVRPNGSVSTLWEGFCPSWEATVTPDGGGSGITLSLLGALKQADLQRSQPSEPLLFFSAWDLGPAISFTLNNVVGRRYPALDGPQTGIWSSQRGGWETRIERVQHLLSQGWTDDGSAQWTIKWSPGRRFRIELKDMFTEQWTATMGTPGISATLTRDLTQAPNVLYGQGTTMDNKFYANLKTPQYIPGRGETPYPFASPNRTLGPGDRDSMTLTGRGVSRLQQRLREMGYSSVRVTGVYDKATIAAVRVVQTWGGLQVDGYTGPQTHALIYRVGSASGSFYGAHYAPMAADMRVMHRLEDAAGADLGPNPKYQPGRLRVESHTVMPDGTAKDDAVRALRAAYYRDSDPGWHGSVTFTNVDPRQGSRFEMRAGDNLRLLGIDALLHISSVDANLEAGSVTVQVDSRARDALTLAQIAKRNRDAIGLGRYPGRVTQRSQLTNPKPLLDSEMVGWIPRFALFQHLWTVIKIPVGLDGSIVMLDLKSEGPKSKYACAIFQKEVTPAFLLSTVGNPLAARSDGGYPFPGDEATESQLDAAGWLETFGGPQQGLGFYPKVETGVNANGDQVTNPVTGRTLETASLQFASESPPWLWLAFYSPVSTYISGRLFVAPEN